MWTLNPQNSEHAMLFLCVTQFLLPNTFCLIELQTTLIGKTRFLKYTTPPHHHPLKLMIQSKKNGKLGTRHDEGEQKI
jgi:hypothetical protein